MRAAICIALLLLSSCSGASCPAEKAERQTKVENEQLGSIYDYEFVSEAHFVLLPDGDRRAGHRQGHHRRRHS